MKELSATKKHTSTRYINATDGLPELYKSREECCGCSACYAICPKGAISMEEDEEGFLYPVIDGSKCVKCGMCMEVCAFKG